MLAAEAAAAGVGVIRSFHDLEGVPADLEGRLSGLPRRPGEIPKAAVTPARLARPAAAVPGRAGLRRRPAPGSSWAWGGSACRPASWPAGWAPASPSARRPGREAAPGHLDPSTLTGLYRFRRLTASTPLYGVIGNPVLHSRSPLLHNRGLAAAGLDGVYLPFQVDDLRRLLRAGRSCWRFAACR